MKLVRVLAEQPCIILSFDDAVFRLVLFEQLFQVFSFSQVFSAVVRVENDDFQRYMDESSDNSSRN